MEQWLEELIARGRETGTLTYEGLGEVDQNLVSHASSSGSSKAYEK
jgi:hypothetical protein